MVTSNCYDDINMMEQDDISKYSSLLGNANNVLLQVAATARACFGQRESIRPTYVNVLLHAFNQSVSQTSVMCQANHIQQSIVAINYKSALFQSESLGGAPP
jgi:hypothetical protein